MVIDVIFIILFKHHSQIVHYYHVSCRRLLYLNLLSMHANIFKSLFHMQCKSFNFAPLGLIAYIWKRVILAFISFFWLQRLLVFVSNIYAIYLFISLSHCTGAGVVSVVMLSSLAALEVVISMQPVQPVTRVPSGWQPFRFSEPPYTETEMLSFWWNFHHWLHWKLSRRQLPMQSVMKISSRWRHFRFSVDNSDNGAMCAGRITTSLFVSCMLLLFYVTFVYFMLSMSDNSPCGYCYLLTVPDVKWSLSFLFFLFLFFLFFSSLYHDKD